jgi:hypothetical protein
VGTNQFFRATPEQTRALVLLTLLLLGIVFWPSIQLAALALQPVTVIRSNQIEALIPRLWMSNLERSAVEARTPCLTIFCSSPRSSVMIQVEEALKLKGRQDAWLARAENVLTRRGFSSPATRTIYTAAGDFLCVESKSDSRQGIMASACYLSESGMIASFEGAASDLKDFNFIVASAIAIKRN